MMLLDIYKCMKLIVIEIKENPLLDSIHEALPHKRFVCACISGIMLMNYMTEYSI